MGRPRSKWLEHVENDLLELKAKSWRQKVDNRGEKLSVVKEGGLLKVSCRAKE
jgi:hypothetical protein